MKVRWLLVVYSCSCANSSNVPTSAKTYLHDQITCCYMHFRCACCCMYVAGESALPSVLSPISTSAELQLLSFSFAADEPEPALATKLSLYRSLGCPLVRLSKFFVMLSSDPIIILFLVLWFRRKVWPEIGNLQKVSTLSFWNVKSLHDLFFKLDFFLFKILFLFWHWVSQKIEIFRVEMSYRLYN